MSDPVEEVTAARVRLAEAEVALREAVAAAREQRVTWSQIGVALGVTRQTAWEKYGPCWR